MSHTTFPISLARHVLRFMPVPIMVRGTEIVMALIKKRHPKLFKNMAALDPAWVCLNPTDIPFQFVLRMGEGASFSLYTGGRDSFDATIAGDLEALIDMLEGRADGDALFFARRLKITGNTETVVALRNTLDREEIVLRDEICAALGPFGDYLKA